MGKRITADDIKISRKTFSSVLYPCLLISRFLGIAPFTKNFQLSKIWVVYSLFVLIFILGNAVYCLFYFDQLSMADPKFSSMKMCLYKFIVSIMVYFAIVSIYFGITQQKKLIHVIEEIDETDIWLEHYGIEGKQSKTKIWFFVIMRIILSIIFTIVFIECRGHLPQNMFSLTIVFVLPASISLFIENQHNTLIWAIQDRLALLAERIEKSSSTAYKQVEFDVLVTVYNRLVEVSQVINEIYGHHILIAVASIFIITTTNANYVVEDMTSIILLKEFSLVPKVILNSYWAAVRLFELWSIISACENAVERAKEFSFELYEYMIEERISRTGKNKKLWLHLTLKKEPQFTACGYFPLNYPLIHSVVAAATTYLVILIQFSRADPKCGDKLQNSTQI